MSDVLQQAIRRARVAPKLPPEQNKPLPEIKPRNVIVAPIPVFRPAAVFSEAASAKDVLLVCCAFYDVSRGEMLGDLRAPRYVRARHVAMTLAREMTNLSYPRIGMAFRRDHTTIISAIKCITAALASDDGPRLKDEMDLVRIKIGERIAARNELYADVAKKIAEFEQ